MRYTRNWKAKKGLIRVTLDLEGNTIKDIHISGDFFMFPENSINDLEDMLKGSDVNSVAEIVKKFYQRGITTPGVDPEDFVKALTVI
ncbi:lipoate--protein ligase [Thermoplasma sp. Kam2015]|uniref:lipoate protein ligase C-terminal domain-containing protein n=1 Tax=Thermoplasma sp. Kam2015 TaxID=2094122 RepID=UPI000D8AFC18|nr:lipoate protein ligase C-terminal domain-containing protein [Thermoplasma sp. Kam2015]PYB68764.1 lipoate--protein ligase [Thermoplasma sp. Kam2015]